MFADIVGYTALSEHLDPERVKRLIDGAFVLLIDEIERFGGRVDKVLGDGILALFGAPVAHEDDPDRAVRASIEMHRTLTHFVEAQSDLAPLIQLRIGVNTGEVVVGTVSGTDVYTAMGDVVNVASRLQSMAPAGGIYVGSSTEARLSPAIERVLVAENELRGREQTEEIWRVTGRLSRHLPKASRHDVSFVGRGTQRELFGSVMSVVAGGNGAVVSVSGEAGSGKSRLVNEALARFPSRNVVIFSGVCAPYGETNVWAPIANALFRIMGTERGANTARLREIVEERGSQLYGFDAPDPRLHRFVEGAMHLLGHPSELDRVAPAQAREILMQVVVEGVHRRSQSVPVVVWIDDLQWADPLLLELLGRLSRSLVDRPVLLVTAQRDDAYVNWPAGHDHPLTIRMPLEPLNRHESDRLLQSVLGDEVSGSLTDQLFERSGGNPLFLTQLAEVARDHPGDEMLPGSLRALIAARLDALGPARRQVIANASVLGTTGPVGALERFAAELDQAYDVADFEALVEDGLLDVDDQWWRFRSDVVREVAYQTLTKSSRAQRHAGTAAVMLDFGLAPIDQVAHHAASAAELVCEIGPVEAVPDDIEHQALVLLRSAAERSLEVGAFSQAIRQASRGLDLVSEAADESVGRDLKLIRAKAAIERRETATAIADAQDALAFAIAERDVRQEAIGRRLVGVIAQQRGDLELARRELSHSVDLLRNIGDDLELATSLSDRGFVEVFGGSLKDADRILAEAEELATNLNDSRRLAWIRQHQAWVAFLSGDTELAEERLTVSSGLFDELGDRSGAGWATGLLAYVRFFERRFVEAEEIAWTVRSEAVEMGELWAPAMMDSLLASIRLWTGRFSEAEELSRRALAGFRELNDRFGVVQALAPRMRALVALGRNQEAERSLEEALSMADAFGDLAIPSMAAAGTAAHLGLGARAVALGEVALSQTKAMGGDGSEVRITLALGQCQIGDPDLALATLLDVSEPRPYSRAVNAIASAMVGIFDDAVEEADLVVHDETSTYLDRVLADIAAGGALKVIDPSLAEARFVRAQATATNAGDAAAIALASAASRALVNENDVASIEHLGLGWQRIIDGIFAAVASATRETRS
ncbi:MAG: class 3 adenylate cyclase/tetratricopeptide (TPR) repeat protein [Ilumatobacter sp.]